MKGQWDSRPTRANASTARLISHKCCPHRFISVVLKLSRYRHSYLPRDPGIYCLFLIQALLFVRGGARAAPTGATVEMLLVA